MSDSRRVVRIHLGHHFYGAGNLGDDFMLAGFVGAMRTLAPEARFTACVPFDLAPLRTRFPTIEWLGYDEATRRSAIKQCDLWLGLGGSPFQSAQSRWFIDHLVGDQAMCAEAGRPMYYLGIGVQTQAELAVADAQKLCECATAIWTRDAASAVRLASLLRRPNQVTAAADLAHLYFRTNPPPLAAPGRLTLVANFDYNSWSGQVACLQAIHTYSTTARISEHVWLAQESRELPGAERALFASLSPDQQARWRLVIPDAPSLSGSAAHYPEVSSPTLPLSSVLERWPSGEYLVTARFHAAFAGAWAGSKVVVIATNEKLRAAARDLACPLIEPDADEATVLRALQAAAPVPRDRLLRLADQSHAACADFVRLITASRSAVAPDHGTP